MDIENRRRFLLEFAEKIGFDPKVPENWRDQAVNIRAHQVCVRCFFFFIFWIFWCFFFCFLVVFAADRVATFVLSRGKAS